MATDFYIRKQNVFFFVLLGCHQIQIILQMKFRNNILLVLVILAFLSCKKEDVVTYDNEDILISNAQAAVYFHTIFREAENAWAIVAKLDYVQTDSAETRGTSSYKKIVYDGEKNVSITYNAWMSGHVQLGGTINVTLPDKVYRADGKSAKVTLESFSINAQRITGSATITFNVSTVTSNDHYKYSLTSGAIYDKNEDKRLILITSDIKDGLYERIDGGVTVKQDDDIWAYTGTMTGLLFEDPNLRYTNTVLAKEKYTVGNETLDGIVHFSMTEKTAIKGLSNISISGQSDIIYAYFGSGYDFITITREN